MQALRARLGSRVRFGEPMSGHTTWKVGGPAWAYCRVRSPREAAWTLSAVSAAGLPWLPLGRGSNLLVGDGGFPGLVLRLGGALAGLRQEGDCIRAGGGAPLAGAVRLAARRDLSGLEWAAGIPASVGGAVAANAGAAGGDMSQVASRLRLWDQASGLRQVAGGDLPAAYRTRRVPAGTLILEAELALRPAPAGQAAARTQEILQRRKASQPLAAHTAGSVFKNPPGDFAGRLIEAAGCKGLAVGDAMVSPRHANFIENQGQARARDILELMELVRARVLASCGVDLEPEVEVVGET